MVTVERLAAGMTAITRIREYLACTSAPEKRQELLEALDRLQQIRDLVIALRQERDLLNHEIAETRSQAMT